LVAVVACAASARGQSAPAVRQSTDCCADDSCDAAPAFAFHDWMSSRPLCALWSRCSAATREVPWANWSASPISVGAFAGAMNGGPLIGDWVGTTTGFDGGWRVGWDVTPSWGTEMRFAFASLALYDSYRADQALIALDNANGLAANDPQRQRFDSRNAEMFQWDVDILYYPWRETRLRPYILAGIGLTDVNFTDRLGQSYHTTCLSLPLGIGLKYLCDDNLALRLDLLDDIAMSNQHLQTQNNLSLTAGLELRFGGSRKIYWPFDLER
jgi:hypothetical protein